MSLKWLRKNKQQYRTFMAKAPCGTYTITKDGPPNTPWRLNGPGISGQTHPFLDGAIDDAERAASRDGRTWEEFQK